jgi:hypothetical protein
MTHLALEIGASVHNDEDAGVGAFPDAADADGARAVRGDAVAEDAPVRDERPRNEALHRVESGARSGAVNGERVAGDQRNRAVVADHDIDRIPDHRRVELHGVRLIPAPRRRRLLNGPETGCGDGQPSGRTARKVGFAERIDGQDDGGGSAAPGLHRRLRDRAPLGIDDADSKPAGLRRGKGAEREEW